MAAYQVRKRHTRLFLPIDTAGKPRHILLDVLWKLTADSQKASEHPPHFVHPLCHWKILLLKKDKRLLGKVRAEAE